MLSVDLFLRLATSFVCSSAFGAAILGFPLSFGALFRRGAAAFRLHLEPVSGIRLGGAMALEHKSPFFSDAAALVLLLQLLQDGRSSAPEQALRTALEGRCLLRRTPCFLLFLFLGLLLLLLGFLGYFPSTRYPELPREHRGEFLTVEQQSSLNTVCIGELDIGESLSNARGAVAHDANGLNAPLARFGVFGRIVERPP